MMMTSLSPMSIFAIGWALFLTNNIVNAVRVYTNRNELNETVHSKTRFSVTNFINPHEMRILDNFIRRHRHYFIKSTYSGTGNYFILNPDKYGMYDAGIFSIPSSDENITSYVNDQINKYSHRMQHPNHMKNARHYLFPSDVAVSILRSMGPLSKAHKVLLEEFETYNYLRDKICAYTSEVFNTTAYPSVQPDIITFYYFPPKPQLEMFVNGRGFAFAPHLDARFVPPPYNRPLLYNFNDIYANIYRKYSSVLFFNDIPPDTGGLFQWFDFPNNFNLPPANGTSSTRMKDPNTGLYIQSYHSPSFSDPDMKMTTVVPMRAKLILFNAEDDVHGTVAYTGNMERWACILALTDAQSHIDQLDKATPYNFNYKLAPKLNTSKALLKHGIRQHSVSRHPTAHPTRLRRAATPTLS